MHLTTVSHLQDPSISILHSHPGPPWWPLGYKKRATSVGLAAMNQHVNPYYVDTECLGIIVVSWNGLPHVRGSQYHYYAPTPTSACLIFLFFSSSFWYVCLWPVKRICQGQNKSPVLFCVALFCSPYTFPLPLIPVPRKKRETVLNSCRALLNLPTRFALK